MTTSLTVIPFVLAMFAAVAAMPLNIYQICAWNAGTLPVEAWRQRTGAALRNVAQGIRAWLASIWSPRLAFACAAMLLAILFAQHAGSHDGVLFAAAALTPAIKAERARLVREAEALKGPDGTFAGGDAQRADFDTKIARIEEINGLERAESDTIVEPGIGDTTKRTAAAAPATEPNDADRGAQLERVRIQGILTACRTARLPQSFADGLIASRDALVDCQTVIFEEMSKRDGGSAGPRPGSGPSYDLSVGADPLVHVRSGIENALLHRMHPHVAASKTTPAQGFQLSDEGRQYRGMSILDVAKSYLNARGVRVSGMSKMEVAGVALGLRGGMNSTSDFANLLADLPNKLLRQAYLEAPQTFSPITRMMTLADFKKARLLQLGEAPALLEVGEHGEYTEGTMGESKEEVQLKTYGRKFSITRQALVNDDTDAFSRVPMAFGRQARNKESDLVWAEITNNAAMGDAVTLFHATHANLSGTSDVLSVASIGAGRTAMRRQTGIDAVSLMNLEPKTLIVSATKETLADQFVSQNLLASQSSNVNPFAGKLTVVAEPRLDVNSTTAWYLAASPDQIDIIVLATLEGENGPRVDSRIGFDVDGVEIKISHDIAAKVVDFRGLWKNPGA
jgi:hypothetical protein